MQPSTATLLVISFLLTINIRTVASRSETCYFKHINETCEGASCLYIKSCEDYFLEMHSMELYNENTHCFILYNINSDGIAVPMNRGCFSARGCEENICHTASSSKGPQLYCCCEGDVCNTDNLVNRSIINGRITTTPPNITNTPGPSDDLKYSEYLTTSIVIILPIIYFILFLLSVLTIIIFCCCNALKMSGKRMYGYKIHKTSQDKEMTSVQSVELTEKIGTGRFAQVFKANYGDSYVAVKIFQSGHQEFENWTREKDLYQSPGLLEHDNILKFISAEIRPFNEYWLVTEYHPHGALMDYLRENTLNASSLLKCALSLSEGLAFLHSTTQVNGAPKPAVAHRDLKTKNILIKPDQSVAIGDMGMAVKFESGLVPDIHEIQEQVGTIRYMAPEVLDGAINFTKEAFLQIDMYSFGIVLWEITSRYSENGHCPKYCQPFESMVSPNPSPREMKELVQDNKIRPTIREDMCKSHFFTILVQTMRECWDSEPLSRLSAACVKERLLLQQKQLNYNRSFPENGSLPMNALSKSKTGELHLMIQHSVSNMTSFEIPRYNNIQNSQSSSLSNISRRTPDGTPNPITNGTRINAFIMPSTGQFEKGQSPLLQKHNSLPTISDLSGQSSTSSN